jgi:hypothetical protein
MNIESYIKAGDEICVMFRSLALVGFCGTVLEVREGEPGARAIVIERADDCAVGDHIATVHEDKAVFSFRRGDSWVDVPCLLSLAEAEAKAGRAVVNEQKRIQKKVPLFADQVLVNTRSAAEWVEGARCTGDENLAARHKAAIQATALRTTVSQRVTPSEYKTLVASRQRYPGSATYGVIFWQKQLDHIEREGTPDIFVPKVTLATTLSFPWLKGDAELTWRTAPGGPKKVRVLFIGSESIMTRLVGEPFTDYDPALIPKRNNWLKPHEFEEAGELKAPPAVEAACHQPVSELEHHHAER